MSPDRAQALKIANELMDTLTINPHQKNSAWPIETFRPLARDYLRLADEEAYRLFNERYLKPQIEALLKAIDQ